MNSTMLLHDKLFNLYFFLLASGIKVKELPDEVIHRLANISYSRENYWEQLARLIGFSLEFIQHLQSYDREGATERLLIQWGESESDATVFELYTMLKQLGCDQAAVVLLSVPFTIKSSTGEIVWLYGTLSHSNLFIKLFTIRQSSHKSKFLIVFFAPTIKRV